MKAFQIMTENRKPQLDRLKEAAKQVEADTSDDALDNIMDKLDLKRKPEVEKGENLKKG